MALDSHFLAQIGMICNPRLVVERANAAEHLDNLQLFIPAPGTVVRRRDGFRVHIPEDIAEMFSLRVVWSMALVMDRLRI